MELSLGPAWSACRLSLSLWILAVVVVEAAMASEDDLSSLPTAQCLARVLPPGVDEWQLGVSGSQAFVSIKWSYGNETCSSMNDCYATSLVPDEPLEPQIIPLQIQKGVQVKFFASPKMDMVFSIHPYLVNEDAFKSCDVSGGKPVISSPSSQPFIVKPEFLSLGSNYFIVDSSATLYECKFGLRLNVTVKAHRCSGVGESMMCWNRGRCIARPLESTYQCACCQGYTGQFCEDVDACVDATCQNGATCVDIRGDVTGKKYICKCSTGYYGDNCENRLQDLCLTNPCRNEATCTGNETVYTCICHHGYTGAHCEVNTNDCHPSPCLNGICVDQVGGHQCFCTPGWGGINCDKQYDECQTNPCRNDGFCINKGGYYECHCNQGYSGKDCTLKVDLCHPSPCQNATECVDYGHYWGCTCYPGFTGYKCEVNINECVSNPCRNGGKCFDEVAGYRCICPEGISGIHCEFTRLPLPGQADDSSSMYQAPIHGSHMHNLYIVAGTLAGALLIALSVLVGCYCRVHETYRKIWSRARGYKAQHNDSIRRQKVDFDQLANSGPTVDAIYEASSHDYPSSSMNAPLVNSLKPRRI